MASHQFLKILYLLFITCATFYYFYLRRTPSTKELSYFRRPASSWTINKRSNQVKGTKLILAWGSFQHTNGFGYGKDTFKKKCGSDRCELIADMRRLSEVDSVVFYVHGIISSKIIPYDIKVTQLEQAPGYPVRLNNEQIFVFFHIEPPTKNRRIPLTHLNDYFNLTMSYLFNTDNDIIWRYSLTNVGKILDYDDQVKLVKAKTKLVAWVVSNCQKPHSIRNRYVKLLSKHIPVDIYGKCATPCNDSWPSMDCFRNIEKQYKFYLAFENSLCVDYITEKAYRTLAMYMVPVVLNGGDNDKLLPPYSYIDVSHFRSPRHLADYLKRLDSNDEEYMEYFEWKKHYKPKRGQKHPFCRLCDILHNKDYKYKTYFKPAQYWNESKYCKTTAEEDLLFGEV
ncbi:hypothetical protein LSH36_291g05006 [Paralvinella palmiformis]|uniref:Fucosyltransferase n=1 Tax=Paralvinella palmiformis TaxID=53620 RepID=A0AAD9JJ26_9ANNE|nr:hypothetical protein LSH36_291g05006 [Paralvinella palmiformis]